MSLRTVSNLSIFLLEAIEAVRTCLRSRVEIIDDDAAADSKASARWTVSPYQRSVEGTAVELLHQPHLTSRQGYPQCHHSNELTWRGGAIEQFTSVQMTLRPRKKIDLSFRIAATKLHVTVDPVDLLEHPQRRRPGQNDTGPRPRYRSESKLDRPGGRR